MAYFIRFFTHAPLSTLIPLQAQMSQHGYRVEPVGTNQLNIHYHPEAHPLTVDLTDAQHETTRETIAGFISLLTETPDHPAKTEILSALPRTEALVVIGVADDYANDTALEQVIGIVGNAAPGFFQVDGEGFYDGTQLILEMA